MRTYDPAERICYVHLASSAVAPPAAPDQEECHRLPDGYANASVPAWRGGARPVAARPALVLLPGGAATADGSARAARPLRLASR